MPQADVRASIRRFRFAGLSGLGISDDGEAVTTTVLRTTQNCATTPTSATQRAAQIHTRPNAPRRDLDVGDCGGGGPSGGGAAQGAPGQSQIIVADLQFCIPTTPSGPVARAAPVIRAIGQVTAGSCPWSRRSSRSRPGS